ncbi:IclR family transcriptional regulator [Kineosporia succinea]|uniref:DNA-binding IclR family transcriptional regulator n=1 Tax=Kineosporia succinea TaxID=84632 RepID=A0ABT9PAJ1_9ACTN|nr:IclR family transcriptional regulator [Kineosporia succinea]MDP9829716.1 DNA-binding IclR family transcriptional regulator [Kineosporia succinea]
MDNEGTAGGVRSVQRAVEILALLSEERTTVTVSEIVAETALAKTTAVRLIHTLEQNGLVWSTARGITAGPGLWRWAYLARQGWELPEEFRALMRELSQSTSETVNLYVRRDVQRVCIAQQQSTQTLRHVVHVGDQLPLWGGASSKILLLEATGSLRERVAATAPVPDAGPRLAEGVQRAREAGFALSHGEREVGVSAVAVPVLTRSGRVGSALTISGPTARFTDERVEGFVAALREVCAQMTRRGFTHPFEG